MNLVGFVICVVKQRSRHHVFTIIPVEVVGTGTARLSNRAKLEPDEVLDFFWKEKKAA